jgi:thiol-disulfide isomerase/thioredoxin
MNKQLLLFLLLCFFIPYYSVSQIVSTNTLEEAFKKAKKENKMVFVEFYNSDCSHCQELEPFFKDIELGKIYNKHFVTYKMNTKNFKDDDKGFMQIYNLYIESIPYFFFFDKDMNFVYYSKPSPTFDNFKEIATKALDSQVRFSYLEQKYKSGDRNLNRLYTYSQWLKILRKDSLLDQISDDLFTKFPKEKLPDNKSYLLLKHCVYKFDNGFFTYWYNHIDSVEPNKMNVSKSDLLNTLSRIAYKSLDLDKKKNYNRAQIARLKEILIKLQINPDPWIYFWEEDLKISIKENQMEEAFQYAQKILEHENYSPQSTAYYMERFIDLFPKTCKHEVINTWLEKLEKNKKLDVDQNTINRLKDLYLKKFLK